MRLRHIPEAEEAIQTSKYVIQNPAACRGLWNRQFPNDEPLHIEVGMGKGQFIMRMAADHPQINYVGIEMYDSVLLRALQKMDALDDPPRNLCFVCMDARLLPEIFAPGEVSCIYLNFSDPWPKTRHAKRRLTSGEFLRRYLQILSEDGRLEFKTDNEPLFDFSLEEAAREGWRLLESTRDLHQDPVLSRDNIMTEYEEKFSARGNPIYLMIAAPSRGQERRNLT